VRTRAAGNSTLRCGKSSPIESYVYNSNKLDYPEIVIRIKI